MVPRYTAFLPKNIKHCILNNFFLSSAFLPDGSPLFESLNLCKEYNINSVEIGSNHCFEDNYLYLGNYHFDFLVHNYFPIPKDSFVLNIASFNKKIRTKSINHIKSAIDFCENIGAKLYTFHPGFLTDPLGSNLSKANYDFQWDENQLAKANYTNTKSLMYNALDDIINYATSKPVRIAIETEGSVYKKDYLLMQRPEEYKEFLDKYSPMDIEINLNIGHLNLAANTFNFKKKDFVNLIQDYIVAMELSHNDGIEDQHLPLQSNEWYWPLICDPRFNHVYKILEFRNTGIVEIVENIKLFQKETYAI
ncbi:MAG: TIM barrel protein [Candidatus Marinimicrobia bacterium]|nr:TIM barrel protein [Candidatus Neomarinimicrobiota bacterium]